MTKQFPAEAIASFLGKIQLLSGCRKEDLLSLASSGSQTPFAGGELILRPGAPVSILGFLLTGRANLAVVDAASGARTQVEQLLPGDIYGEVGLLLGSGNPLSVVAEEDCLTLQVDRQQMVPLFRQNPELGLLLAKQISARFVQVCLLGMRGTSLAAGPRQAPAPASPPPREEPLSGGGRPDGIQWVEVGSYSLTPEVLGMIPSQLIQKHRLLPLELRGTRLTVGMVNPRSLEALQEMRRVLHTVDPEVVAISMDDFSQAFVRLKLDAGEARSQMASAMRNLRLTYTVTQDKGQDKGQLIIGDEVISLFDRILIEAVERGASDIHVEPDSTGVRVRFRVQGTLVERQEFLAPSYAAPLVARIKVLAELDITEHRMPQDGRIAARVGKRELNLRVSTMAVARGEKAVLRIIDPSDVMRPLHQIFVKPDQAQAVRAVLADPFGAIVVAGPTGSGKSSTLYSMLNERRLTRPDNNIVTVEDPVEYLLQGVTQVPVIPRVGLGFATVLRGLMRQDPDVIMIGELRDGETASIMVEAALTGHLVLTSTHGNDASAVIQRLQHFGLDAVILSQALSMIVVQRLAGRLCPSCVTDAEVAPALLQNLVARKVLKRAGATLLPRPVGCEACKGAGYIGRVAVEETLQIDDELRVLLARGVGPAEILESARQRGRFTSFADGCAYLIARRLLAASDAMLIVSG